MNDNKSYQASVVEYTPKPNNASGGFLQSFQERYAKVDPASYLRRPDETSWQYWSRRLFTLKPVELLKGEYEHSSLRKALNAWQLIFVGIGAIIGTGNAFSLLFIIQVYLDSCPGIPFNHIIVLLLLGIFVLSGQAAAQNAGPAVTISFIVAAIASGIADKEEDEEDTFLSNDDPQAFAALSYSELAAMIPVSGSAYTYAYATMGEVRIIFSSLISTQFNHCVTLHLVYRLDNWLGSDFGVHGRCCYR